MGTMINSSDGNSKVLEGKPEVNKFCCYHVTYFIFRTIVKEPAERPTEISMGTMINSSDGNSKVLEGKPEVNKFCCYHVTYFIFRTIVKEPAERPTEIY